MPCRDVGGACLLAACRAATEATGCAVKSHSPLDDRRRLTEDFRLGRLELIVAQFPVRMELGQALKTGQLRLCW